MSLITLTTDFGTRDAFVGTMKGVILGIHPAAVIIDLTHAIPPGDLRAGAFALAASCRFFPEGTIHLAVVDPGVGSGRKAIAVRTSRYAFIGPDNGILSLALAREEVLAIHEVRNEALFLQPVSRTFHGRDVFAPVAAHVGCGQPLNRLGPRLKDFLRLPWPKVTRARREVRGEVIYIDRFGNAITNIDSPALAHLRGPGIEVLRLGKRVCRVRECYAAVPAGRAVAVLSSCGFLEIALNGGNASERLKLPVGAAVAVRAR